MNFWFLWLILLFWAGLADLCWTCVCICGHLVAGWSRMASLTCLLVNRLLMGWLGHVFLIFWQASWDSSHRDNVVRTAKKGQTPVLKHSPNLCCVTFTNATRLRSDTKNGEIDSTFWREELQRDMHTHTGMGEFMVIFAVYHNNEFCSGILSAGEEDLEDWLDLLIWSLRREI